MKSLFTKKIRSVFSFIMMLCITVPSLGVPAEVFAAGSDTPASVAVKYNQDQNWTTIEFDKVDGAESYNVYRAETPVGQFERIQTVPGNNTFTVDDFMKLKVEGTLKADFLYYYKVSAVVVGKEQTASAPVANQEVVAQSIEPKSEEAAAAPQTDVASGTYGSSKHKTGCDGKHSGRTCNTNAGKHDKDCDKNHSSSRKCNTNNWKHASDCDKKHRGQNCNKNKYKHQPDCDKNHSGNNCKHDPNCDKNHNGNHCNSNNWHHKPNCDEKHNDKNCNNNWNHHGDCDRNHSGKECNQNNYTEKWDAVKMFV